MRLLAILVLLFADSALLAQAPSPLPDPAFGAPNAPPSSDPPANGNGDAECCTVKPIMWLGQPPELGRKHKMNVTVRRVDGYEQWSDLWYGDDECRQMAKALPEGDEFPLGLIDEDVEVRAEARQTFEFADYTMFTSEIGFPSDHVHPSVDITGRFQWAYSPVPTRGLEMPGIRLECTIYAEPAVRSQGAIAWGSSQAASSGRATGYVEWSHPCSCKNPVSNDPSVRLPFFVEERETAGECSFQLGYEQKIEARLNHQTVRKERQDGEEEFEGNLDGDVAWSSRVYGSMKDLSYSVGFEMPTPSRSLVAESKNTYISIPFRCMASVTQNGTSENGWFHTGYSSGDTAAVSKIRIENIHVEPVFMPISLPGMFE